MTLVRYEPWNVMDRLHRQIDQIFGDSFAVPAAAGETDASWTPSVDIHEYPDKFVVTADLPGVESKDIDVTADHGVLTLRGRRQFERRENQKGFERLERPGRQGVVLQELLAADPLDQGAHGGRQLLGRDHSHRETLLRP